MKALLAILGFVLLVWAIPGWVNSQAQPLEAIEQPERYRQLLGELRCVKCQNQSLADSDAPIAKDLRRIVREKLAEGASDQQIKDFLAERYGEFVLYQPPVGPHTWLLWFGPALFVLLGIGMMVTVWRKQSAPETRE